MTGMEKTTMMLMLPKTRKFKSLVRHGTATVEFAVVATFLMTLTLGTIEITRAIQVKNVLSDAARSGCRLGSQPGYTSQQVTDNVNAVLTNNGITTTLATVTILVNGSSKDISKASKGDQISVKVAVTIANISWNTPLFFANSEVESETVVMMHQ